MKTWTQIERQDVLTRLAAGEASADVAATYGVARRAMMRTVYGWRKRGTTEDRRKTLLVRNNSGFEYVPRVTVPPADKIAWLSQPQELTPANVRTRRAYLQDRAVQIHRTYHELIEREEYVTDDILALYASLPPAVKAQPRLDWQRLKLPRPRTTWRPA